MQLTIQQTREASILLIRKEKQEEERIELYKKKERKEKITKIIILSSLAFLFPTVIFITRRHLYKFYNKMKSLKKETKIYVISSLVGIALLTLAIFIEPANRRHSGLPYGFYTFLRIYITLLFSYFAYLRYKQEKIILFLIFVCAAILFNPIIQIHLNRDIWQIIDITATAIIFLHLIFLISKKRIERG
jgi:FtsH-binding integral membrane protein